MTVLLLHGQPGRGRDWGPVVAELGDDVTALAVDRPGWDGSPAGDLRLSADRALANLDETGAQRAIVVGHSYGGAVAALLAAQHPERVSALVLLAPSASRESLITLDRLMALPAVGYVLSTALLCGAGAALTSGHLRRRLLPGFEVDEDYVRDAARWMLAPATWSSFATEQRALVRDLPELERLLAEITVPTTIVIGTSDPVVPPPSAQALARQIPGAKLVEIQGAGHMLTFQHPRRIAELILAAAAPDLSADPRNPAAGSAGPPAGQTRNSAGSDRTKASTTSGSN
jgi:pimeloyl-ACP methyl ester carboxylesterase